MSPSRFRSLPAKNPQRPRDPLDEAAARLQEAGQRATRNRLAIVEVLSGSRQPLTIREIVGRRRGLALSSAYRNLAVLEEASVVRRLVTGGDHARFELAEDLTRHHHHLVCASCGAVEDFSASGPLERRVEEAMAQAAARAGFTPQGHRIDLIGLCRRCA
jgi:Fur family ferric uptake transcriptional regulator